MALDDVHVVGVGKNVDQFVRRQEIEPREHPSLLLQIEVQTLLTLVEVFVALLDLVEGVWLAPAHSVRVGVLLHSLVHQVVEHLSNTLVHFVLFRQVGSNVLRVEDLLEVAVSLLQLHPLVHQVIHIQVTVLLDV